MNPREGTQRNYDRLSRWYDWIAGSEKKFTETGLGMLDVQIGEHVLEIGSGTGGSLTTIARQAGDTGLAVGVDLSPGMIEVARKRIQSHGTNDCAQLVQGDGTFLPFAPHSFEAAFLSFTIELFSEEEISLVLDECRRVLKQNGRLGIVSLVKQDSPACRLYEWGHERWPTMLDCRPIYIRESLEAGGFRVQAAQVKAMWGLPVGIVLARPV